MLNFPNPDIKFISGPPAWRERMLDEIAFQYTLKRIAIAESPASLDTAEIAMAAAKLAVTVFANLHPVLIVNKSDEHQHQPTDR